MTNYTKSTNFASKDSLASGNPLKVVKGTEIDTEFNNLVIAVGTKADSLSPLFTGTPQGPTATAGDNTTQLATTAYVVATQAAAAGSTLQPYNAATAFTNVTQSYTKAQRGSVVALTDGATITPDFATGNNFSVTLAGNRTLASPTNLTAGQHGSITITQDATGSRTLAYGSYWKFSGGTAPSLTTTANAVDVLAYYVESATRITAKLITDVK